MQGKRISDETKEEIIRLCQQGLKRDAIRERTGVGRASCRRVLADARKAGVLPPAKSGGRPPITQDVRDAIFHLRHETNLTCRTIADRLSVSEVAVSKYYRVECARRGEVPRKPIRRTSKAKANGVTNEVTNGVTNGVTKNEVTSEVTRREYHAACRICGGDVRFSLKYGSGLVSFSDAGAACGSWGQYFWAADVLDVDV